MVSANHREVDTASDEYASFRADLMDQYRRNCFGCAASCFLVALVTHFSPWSIVIIAIWTLLLGLEGRRVFSRSNRGLERDFERWQERAKWRSRN